MSALDTDALLAEADDPAAAREIILAMAARLRALQVSGDALRIENTLLKRTSMGGASTDVVARLRTDLRDLRSTMRKLGLDKDVVVLISGTNSGLLLDAPAALDQSLPLNLPPGLQLRDLRPLHLAPALRYGALAAITSAFRLVHISALSLPLSEHSDWAQSRRGAAPGLARGERVEALCRFDEFAPPKMLVLVTRSGWARTLPWSLAEGLLASGQGLTPPAPDDGPIWLGACDGGDLVVLTRNGRYGRLPIDALEPAGSRSVSLEADDDVVGATVLAPDGVLVACGADGAILQVHASGLAAHKRPGGKTGLLQRGLIGQALFAIGKESRNAALLALTLEGELTVVALRGLPVAGKPHEARSINTIGGRLAAITLL